MPTVAIDARDATGSQLRGWGRYVRDLVDALRALPEPVARWLVLDRGGPGPELAWEQAALPLLLRRRGADVVHAPNCFLPLRRPCPGVVTVTDLAFEAYPEDFGRRTGWKYRTFTPRAVRSAERVIAISAFTRDDLVARYHVDPAKVRVIHLAPSLAVGSAEPPQRGPYLLAVGDLRAKKNHERLVHAWRALRAEGLPHRLVLAGADAGEGPRLRAAAGGEPLEITGYVDDARLDALMRGADLLVHPSLYEGFGLVVVEAMERGVPVVAARTTSLPEAGGDAALYADPLDVEDLTASIRAVLEEPERRAAMVAAGRARAAQLSWEATARATAAVYEELL